MYQYNFQTAPFVPHSDGITTSCPALSFFDSRSISNVASKRCVPFLVNFFVGSFMLILGFERLRRVMGMRCGLFAMNKGVCGESERQE